MRLKSVVAPNLRQAMAKLRASLGEDAVIVATQELPGGGVRLTGAIEQKDLDLAELLAPSDLSPCAERLAAIAEHHELPAALRACLIDASSGLAHADPAAALGHSLAALFRFEPLPVPTRMPLLLAGPPGVGKTASVAKLAARAILEGRSVEVVTADAERAGGLAQLAALLAPLGLHPRAADDPTAVKRAVADRTADLVLVDSPGLNPFRSSDLGHLSALLEASAAEPVLVLAAGAGVADSADIGQTFVALGAKRLLATKLDAARRLGGLLAAAAAGLALGEAGIGATIGHGLGVLSAGGLARLLLHAEEIAPSLAAGPARAPSERTMS